MMMSLLAKVGTGMKINYRFSNKFSNNMTKIGYEKPMIVDELEIDSVEVLCTSDLIEGGLDDMTREDIDWSWTQE